MRASLTEIPGVSFNFSQPIKDNVEEAVSGVRGKVVLKIFGTDLDAMRADARDAVRALDEGAAASSISACTAIASVPQLQVVLDRPALARAGISVEQRAGRRRDRARRPRRHARLWQNERPVPVRVILPFAEREDEERIGDLAVPTASGGRVPLREIAQIEKTIGRRRDQPRGQQPRRWR